MGLFCRPGAEREFVVWDFPLTRFSIARSILWIACKVREIIFFFPMESLQKNFTNICSSKKVLLGKVIADKRNINLLKGEVF